MEITEDSLVFNLQSGGRLVAEASGITYEGTWVQKDGKLEMIMDEETLSYNYTDGMIVIEMSGGELYLGK